MLKEVNFKMIKLKTLLLENTFKDFEENIFKQLWLMAKEDKPDDKLKYAKKMFKNRFFYFPNILGFVMDAINKGNYTDKTELMRGVCKTKLRYCYSNAVDYYKKNKDKHNDLHVAVGYTTFPKSFNYFLNLNKRNWDYKAVFGGMTSHGFLISNNKVIDPTFQTNKLLGSIYFYEIVSDNIIDSLKSKNSFSFLEKYLESLENKYKFNLTKKIEFYFNKFNKEKL